MTRFVAHRRVPLLRCLLAVLMVSALAIFLSPAPARADYVASNLPDWAIGPFTRSANNPILTPQGTGFESVSVYNPGVLYENGQFTMLYRGADAHRSAIGLATSTTGLTYTRYAGNPVIADSNTQSGGFEDPRLVKLGNTYYTYYTDYANGTVNIALSTSTDRMHWTSHGIVIPHNKNAAVLTDPTGQPVLINGTYVMYYGGDSGGTSCGGAGCGAYLAYSTDLITWTGNTPVNFKFPASFVPWEVCVALTNYPTIQGQSVQQNIVIFVAGTLMANGQWYYGLSETEFAHANLTQQLGQLTDAVLSPSAPYELTGHTNRTVFMNSIFFANGQWWMYYGGADSVVALANAPLRTGTQAAFSTTSLETGQRLPDGTDVVDGPVAGQQNGGLSNVTGIVGGPGIPELGLRQERAHAGSTALLYSGSAQGGSTDYAYLTSFDLSATPYPLTTKTTISYWIYPSSHTSSSNVSGTNSTCVALDLILSDKTATRNDGIVDQNGNRLHPAYQCNHLTLDTWNHVTANLGKLAGKTVQSIDVGYDQPGSTGGYRGYLDDIALNG